MDIKVIDHGSVILFHLLTPEANTWVDKNVSKESQFMGNALVVEPRFADDLCGGMIADGLKVEI